MFSQTQLFIGGVVALACALAPIVLSYYDVGEKRGEQA